MTHVDAPARAKAPVHLWIAGGLSLLWNAFGAFDYTMTQTRNDAYLASFTAEQRAYFDSFPAWVDGTWALGVWGALAGSVLLLLRNRYAVTAFAVSLAGLALSTLYQFVLSDVDALAIMPPEAAYITVVIWIVAVLLLVYAWWLRGKGSLR